MFVEKILNYEHIYQNLLTPLSETKLISELKEISKNFTINRDKIGEYVVSKEMVSAYTSFYLPTNIPKFYFLMNQLPEKIRQRIGELDFLDVGTGPGTYLVAHDQYFENGKRLYGLDSSSLMLEQAKKLLGDRVVLSSALPTDFSGGVLLFGNSLNEMKSSKGLELVKRTNPEIVLLIEPGTKESFFEVSAFRKVLLEQGYGVVYPCPEPQKACPAKGDEWCHQVLRTVHDPDVERLSQLIALDRRAMPMVAHCYEKNHESSNHRALFYRFLKETKHSFDWQVCLEGQDELVIFEIPKRGMKKKEIKQFASKSVGEAFDYKIEKELGDDKFRVSIKR